MKATGKVSQGNPAASQGGSFEPSSYLSFNLEAGRKASQLLAKYQVDQKKNPAHRLPAELEGSTYRPSQAAQDRISLVRKHMTYGDVTMQTPRVEFNDLSTLVRGMVDQMSFNTYQSNNGQPNADDQVNAWRSRARRPLTRNKCISVAAHATARLVYPKIHAWNSESDEERDAAQAMRDLLEWTCDQSDYQATSISAVISALTDPAAIVHTGYSQAYRTVRRKQADGSFKQETVLDELYSGFKDTVVPYDQLYIENFYEPDIQAQGWLVWRRVVSYDTAQAKYASSCADFAFVKPNVQIIYNDANQGFYQLYDTVMRPEMVEEIQYFNRALDLHLTLVNGVLVSDPDEPNERSDKRYPFAKMFYEHISNRCFYGKSLSFKLMQDDTIVNDLYQMIVDGAFLSLFPPMVATGADSIDGSVIQPGVTTTFTDPNSNLQPIQVGSNLQSGLAVLQQVEESVSESAESAPSQSAQTGTQTAYEIAQINQTASTMLGLFIKMVSSFVKQYGNLRVSDIVQYLTLPEVESIEGTTGADGQGGLKYRSFMLAGKGSSGSSKKLQFDLSLPSGMVTPEQSLKISYSILEQEMAKGQRTEIWKLNPVLMANLKYLVQIDADVENPMSDELEKAYNLEAYDRAIQNPIADQETVFREFLLANYDASKRDPDRFIQKAQGQPGGQPAQMPGNQPPQPIGQQMPPQFGAPAVPPAAPSAISSPARVGVR